jgi:hypothetical protein
MYNCRYDEHESKRILYGERYGVPPELRNVRPVVYISANNAGLYLPGVKLLPYAAEMLDRFAAGESVDSIQNAILYIYNG